MSPSPSPPLDNIQVMVIVWRLRGNIIRTALCWIVWRSVHSPHHTYVSSSYRSNRLGLSHWDPYAVHRGDCLELYYCNVVEWFWCDSSLISTTSWFHSVLWHCWFGHLACKNRPRNDLLCVEWDVKPLHYYHWCRRPSRPSLTSLIDIIPTARPIFPTVTCRSPIISSCCSHHVELSPSGCIQSIPVFTNLPSASEDISFPQILSLYIVIVVFFTFIHFRGLWNRSSYYERR